MFLSKIHQDILYYCYRHKYVSIESIRALYPRNISREHVRRQLRKMVNEHLLQRFKIFEADLIVDMVYTINKKGIDVLSETVIISKQDYEYMDALKQSYKHRALLADIDIRLRMREKIEWYAENESTHRYGDKYSEIIRPDAIMNVIEESDEIKTYFIEYENKSRPKELAKKIQQYDRYLLYDSHLTHPHIKITQTFALYILVDTEKRKENCLIALAMIPGQQFEINVLTIAEFKELLAL